ncbi:UPF0587 protein [Amphibalanus amphitrite]|uniref:UPF0587 protein n=1 Tax=Amphibalanus amphitrite TaxID=1232801 RepID=A0A6A4WY40_AMPAM|nr:UPF0587 protein [Amphibalanus amphitrite]
MSDIFGQMAGLDIFGRTVDDQDTNVKTMVHLGLQLRATLENVTDIQPQPDDDDFRWYVKLRCNHCGDQPDHFVYLCATEEVPVKGGRGHANMAVKCKLCGRDNHVDIVPGSVKPLTESEKFQTVVEFDCRGVELTDFSPRVGWTCRGAESGTKFGDVDLSEKEWVEYDEKAGESVGIYDVQSQFVKLKN